MATAWKELKKFRSQSLKAYAKWQIEAVSDVADDLHHLNVRSLETINGFHSDVIKLESQNSEVSRILIYTRLKINKK